MQDLVGQSVEPGASLLPIYCLQYLWKGNDETKLRLCARSDVTRGCGNFSGKRCKFAYLIAVTGLVCFVLGGVSFKPEARKWHVLRDNKKTASIIFPESLVERAGLVNLARRWEAIIGADNHDRQNEFV